MEEAVRSGCRLIYVEIPTNPTMKIVNLKAVACLSEKFGAISIVEILSPPPLIRGPWISG